MSEIIGYYIFLPNDILFNIYDFVDFPTFKLIFNHLAENKIINYQDYVDYFYNKKIADKYLDSTNLTTSFFKNKLILEKENVTFLQKIQNIEISMFAECYLDTDIPEMEQITKNGDFVLTPCCCSNVSKCFTQKYEGGFEHISPRGLINCIHPTLRNIIDYPINYFNDMENDFICTVRFNYLDFIKNGSIKIESEKNYYYIRFSYDYINYVILADKSILLEDLIFYLVVSDSYINSSSYTNEYFLDCWFNPKKEIYRRMHKKTIFDMMEDVKKDKKIELWNVHLDNLLLVDFNLIDGFLYDLNNFYQPSGKYFDDCYDDNIHLEHFKKYKTIDIILNDEPKNIDISFAINSLLVNEYKYMNVDYYINYDLKKLFSLGDEDQYNNLRYPIKDGDYNNSSDDESDIGYV